MCLVQFCLYEALVFLRMIFLLTPWSTFCLETATVITTTIAATTGDVEE